MLFLYLGKGNNWVPYGKESHGIQGRRKFSLDFVWYASFVLYVFKIEYNRYVCNSFKELQNLFRSYGLFTFSPVIPLLIEHSVYVYAELAILCGFCPSFTNLRLSFSQVKAKEHLDLNCVILLLSKLSTVFKGALTLVSVWPWENKVVKIEWNK